MGDFQLLISKNRLSTVLAGWQLIGVWVFFRGEALSLLHVCWCVSQFYAIMNINSCEFLFLTDFKCRRSTVTVFNIIHCAAVWLTSQ